MKKSTTILLQALIGLLPLAYLYLSWDSLPEKVPTHFNGKFEADAFGDKFSLVKILAFMYLTGVGTALLILNINKIDPKQPYREGSSLLLKISWTLCFFLCLISLTIVYATVHYSSTSADEISPKLLSALISLLFVTLGNFMNNIKPNYFIGIRIPWTLNDEDNWKKTHRLAAKIWFYGGLILFISILILPSVYAGKLLTFGLLPLVLIPIVYSFLLFKYKKKEKEGLN